MATYTSFTKCFRDIQKRIETAKKQALNKSITSTRAKYAKEVSSELGITSGKARQRARLIRATGNNLGATLSIGTKIGLAAHDFKTSKVKIQTSRGVRYGAVYRLKSQGRMIAPGGVIIKAKRSGKNLVLTNLGNRKYQTVRVDVFVKAVEKMRPALQTYLVDTFKKNFSSSLSYNLNR